LIQLLVVKFEMVVPRSQRDLVYLVHQTVRVAVSHFVSHQQRASCEHEGRSQISHERTASCRTVDGELFLHRMLCTNIKSRRDIHCFRSKAVCNAEVLRSTYKDRMSLERTVTVFVHQVSRLCDSICRIPFPFTVNVPPGGLLRSSSRLYILSSLYVTNRLAGACVE
jgi:hypothetical protein